LACSAWLIVAISSRKIEPPSASAKRPFLLAVAPVNAPLTWPNSSDSSRLSGIAASASRTSLMEVLAVQMETGRDDPTVDQFAEVFRAVEPEHYLVLQWEPAKSTWTFGLYPESGGCTRLVSRNRLPGSGPIFWAGMIGFMEPGSLIMERKMLLGIKQRAEALRTDSLLSISQTLC
jgi:hypothetical protein